MNIEDKIAQMSPEQIEQETDSYKAKLDAEGVKYHHNSKLITLVKLWQNYEAAKLEEQAVEEAKPMTPMELRQKQIQEQLRLIRVRITNHNPAKKNITGEIFTTGNSVIGDVKRLVPFNCDAANEYHLPYIMLNALKSRRYTQRTTRTVQGKTIVTEKDVPEFSFDELPPLTEADLKELARKQAMANGSEV